MVSQSESRSEKLPPPVKFEDPHQEDQTGVLISHTLQVKKLSAGQFKNLAQGHTVKHGVWLRTVTH